MDIIYLHSPNFGYKQADPGIKRRAVVTLLQQPYKHDPSLLRKYTDSFKEL